MKIESNEAMRAVRQLLIAKNISTIKELAVLSDCDVLDTLIRSNFIVYKQAINADENRYIYTFIDIKEHAKLHQANKLIEIFD